MDFEKICADGIKEGLSEYVGKKMSGGYGRNPLEEMVQEIIKAKDGELRKLITDSVAAALGDDSWKREIVAAVRHKLATLLIGKIGGEVEKQVNALRAD